MVIHLLVKPLASADPYKQSLALYDCKIIRIYFYYFISMFPILRKNPDAGILLSVNAWCVGENAQNKDESTGKYGHTVRH